MVKVDQYRLGRVHRLHLVVAVAAAAKAVAVVAVGTVTETLHPLQPRGLFLPLHLFIVSPRKMYVNERTQSILWCNEFQINLF